MIRIIIAAIGITLLVVGVNQANYALSVAHQASAR